MQLMDEMKSSWLILWTLSAPLTLTSSETCVCLCPYPSSESGRHVTAHAIPTIGSPQLAPPPNLRDGLCFNSGNHFQCHDMHVQCEAKPGCTLSPRSSRRATHSSRIFGRPWRGSRPCHRMHQLLPWLACWRTRLIPRQVLRAVLCILHGCMLLKLSFRNSLHFLQLNTPHTTRLPKATMRTVPQR